MHFEEGAIPQDNSEDQGSQQNYIRIPPPRLPSNRRPARNKDLDHDSIMKIYENWQKHRSIEDVDREEAKPPHLPNSTPHLPLHTGPSSSHLPQHAGTSNVQPPRQPNPPSEESKSKYNLSKGKQNKVSLPQDKDKPVSPKPPIPKRKSQTNSRLAKEEESPIQKQNELDNFKAPTSSKRVTDSFKKKLFAQGAKQPSVASLEGRRSAPRKSPKKDRFQGKKDQMEQLDRQLASLAEAQMQLQLQIKDIHKQSKLKYEHLNRKLKFQVPAQDEKADRQKVENELKEIEKQLQTVVGKQLQVEGKLASAQYYSLFYQQDGSMKQVYAEPQPQPQPQPQPMPSPQKSDLRSVTNTSYFKSERTVESAGSYYLRKQRKNEGVREGRRGRPQQTIAEESEEQLIEEDNEGKPERVKFNEQLRNLLFD